VAGGKRAGTSGSSYLASTPSPNFAAFLLTFPLNATLAATASTPITNTDPRETRPLRDVGEEAEG